MSSNSSFTSAHQDLPLEQKLAVGGSTCDCYLVRLYGKLHFLKQLKPSLRTHPQYAAALQKEFETGYLLDHPHLVRYISRTDDGVLMEYIDGETLDEFVRQHPDYLKNRRHADRFLRQLLSVVGYLHDHQIVHLDLKPANIMITRVGHDVKLIDLGFCYTDAYTDTMGRTDKYAAPEQKDGSSLVDARTDIYALGRILQTLPCARYYNKVIKRCTAQDPAKRFQTTDDILRKIRQTTLSRRIILSAIIISAVLLLAFLVFFRPQAPAEAPAAPADSSFHSQPDSSTSITPSSPSQPDSAASITPSQSDSAASSSTTSSSSSSPAPSSSSSPQPVSAVSPSSSPSTSPSPSISQPVSVAPTSSSPSSSRSISDADLEKRLKTVITPVFQRVMGSLSDSTWNNHTQMMFNDRSIPLLEQCGDAVRKLWRDLSKKYDIDERSYYRMYSRVLTTMENNLYDRMLKNGRSPQ